MQSRSNIYRTIAAAVALGATPFVGGPNTAHAAALTWKGVDFETQGTGSAEIDTNGDLLLKPTSDSFGVHTNRIPDGTDPSPINANDTPYISFSYDDPGGSQKIDVSVQDEGATGAPRASAGSLFSATKVASATYGDTSAERNSNETYLFFDGGRAAVSHDALLGHTADGTLYAGFDGEPSSSDIFKDQNIDFDFNDVLLRARNASGDTIRFTDFDYGDDFTPSQIPEPLSLGLVGVGVGLMLTRRWHRAENE